MQDRLKPIETVYNGDRFRSRREARFAVLLTELGVPYRYETEGFNLGGGIFYLPDFWLKISGAWVEIKGKPPTLDEIDKATRLALLGNHPTAIFWGDYRPKFFASESLIFFKDDDGVFHSEQGTAHLFLGIEFWFRDLLESALTKARQERFS